MEVPRDAKSQAFLRALRSVENVGRRPDLPRLEGEGSRKLEAWFLGPKGENGDEFERLVIEAVRDQVYWRRNYHPADPNHITDEIKRSPEFVQAMDLLKDGYRDLLAFLKKSVPFFSMRYQGHMNWETTLPGALGYFAAMLYNPNNVAFEGSTATTILELLVGDDLCRMLGYEISPLRPTDVRPWGHITCDGTVANIEALWSSRNLKFYALAFQAAVKDDPRLSAALDVTVPSPKGGATPLLDLAAWQLLNLHPDDILALPGRLTREYGIAADVVAAAVSRFSVQTLGCASFARKFLAEVPLDPVVFVPGTKHYSFPKAAALLGLGAENLINVSVDLDGRMEIADLKRRLDQCLGQGRPVIAVVAVIGTTEESAVDPLSDILDLQSNFAKQGLVFQVHADAAWGGYHRSVINDDFDLPKPPGFVATAPIDAPLSAHVEKQFQVLGRADSITVDPHKSGYIPYPAGALCYRNAAMRNLVTFSAPVVFHGEAEPTVGIYGIEGSKPGASAAAVYLSHRVIRPSRNGYGKIIGQALFSCRMLYARLLSMPKPSDPFVVVPLPRTPSERAGGSEAPDRKRIADLIDGRSADDIRHDPIAMALLKEIGPDQNILAYAFNFKMYDGSTNTDLIQANELNTAIYRRLSISPGHDIYNYDLIVSTTDLDVATYGSAFIDNYKHRLGVANSPGGLITVLRSVVMDPWVTDTPRGSFIDTLELEFRKAVMGAIEQVRPSQVRGY
ncbi:glutamate/tyrosine decarboxylase-like PLP-dependent enzyme [Bradyrhizobium japonicum]